MVAVKEWIQEPKSLGPEGQDLRPYYGLLGCC